MTESVFNAHFIHRWHESLCWPEHTQKYVSQCESVRVSPEENDRITAVSLALFKLAGACHIAEPIEQGAHSSGQ